MSSAVIAVAGLAAIALVLVWLSWLKKKDVFDSAAVLGLTPAASGIQHRGTTPEGVPFHESVVAEGTMDGVAAQLLARITSSVVLPKAGRNLTQFTVLALRSSNQPKARLRLQPSGTPRQLERLVHDTLAVVPTGDADFDAAYSVYADDPAAARAALPPDLRAALVAFRAARAKGHPGSAADRATSALLLGTFNVEGDRAVYYVYGSPTRKTAEHLKQAAPLLTRLAGL